MNSAEDLSQQLWTMRELLQHLVYKLEVQGLLISANRMRFVPFATAEVDAIFEALDEVNRARERASSRVAVQYGLPSGARLSDLIERVGPPWSALLAQHRLHLLSLNGEIEEISRGNQEVSRRAVARSREVIDAMGENTLDVYDPHGTAVPLLAASQRLDRAI